MSNRRAATLAAALCGAVSGCSNDRPPLIEEYTGTGWLTRSAVMSNISTDASYRSAYILLQNGVTRPESAEDRRRFPGQFCPEPPPDVAQAVSAAISAALKGEINVPAGQTGGSVEAGFDKAVATAVSPLIQRSQGLQFFRDQAFYTCVAYLNGALDADQYRQKLIEGSHDAASIIAFEVLFGEKAELPTQPTVADIKKALELLKEVREGLPSGGAG